MFGHALPATPELAGTGRAQQDLALPAMANRAPTRNARYGRTGPCLPYHADSYPGVPSNAYTGTASRYFLTTTFTSSIRPARRRYAR